MGNRRRIGHRGGCEGLAGRATAFRGRCTENEILHDDDDDDDDGRDDDDGSKDDRANACDTGQGCSSFVSSPASPFIRHHPLRYKPAKQRRFAWVNIHPSPPSSPVTWFVRLANARVARMCFKHSYLWSDVNTHKAKYGSTAQINAFAPRSLLL